MKILFVAVFTPNSTNVSQSRGFKENNCEVYEYDYRSRLNILGNMSKRDDELIRLTESYNPDLVVFSKCNNMHHRVVEGCNRVSKTCMWYMDAMHNFDQELIQKAKRVNYFISGVEGVTPNASKYCDKTFFVHQCPDEEMNFRIDGNEYRYDISFIGSIDNSKIHNNRGRVVKTLSETFDGFRHHNGVFGLEHNEIVNQSKINLNFAPTDATGASVRVYKILASGGFLMTTPWVGLEETFTPNENIIVFEDEKDLIEKCEYFLSHEDERERIRTNGYEKSKDFLPKEWAKRIIDSL